MDIEKGVKEYLETVGNVDRKDIVELDFRNGIDWAVEQLKANPLDADVREKIAEFYKLTCLNEDGDIENNGYYISEDLAKLAKDFLDKEPRNNKYGIKQNIIKCEFDG